MNKWPRFVGNAGLADTLSPSLTAKAQLVEKIHDVRLYLVQGSPSWSSKSGGTHAGAGNAADWATLGSTRLDVAVSQSFRQLGCLSYVRGQDVDINGRVDDSFGPHIHVIDLDSDLTVDQIWQRDLYRQGLNGLTNRLADAETKPSITYTIAEWLTKEEQLTMSDITEITNRLDRLIEIEVETQKRVSAQGQQLVKVAAQVNRAVAIATENQRRLGWQAKEESISDQIGEGS